MGLNKRALLKTFTPNWWELFEYTRIVMIIFLFLGALMSVSLGIAWLLVTLLGSKLASWLVVGAMVLVYFIILVVEPLYERYKRYDSIQE